MAALEFIARHATEMRKMGNFAISGNVLTIRHHGRFVPAVVLYWGYYVLGVSMNTFAYIMKLFPTSASRKHLVRHIYFYYQ
jgi:hypothetical protein